MINLLMLTTMLLTFGFAIAQNYIRSGSSKYHDVVANFDGTYLRKGSSKYNDIIANFDGTVAGAVTDKQVLLSG